MLSYIDTQQTMHLRTIDFSFEEYLFVLQVVLGEDDRVAYASIFDSKNFERNVPSEGQEEYLNTFTQDALSMLSRQNCIQLKSFLEQEYQAEIQTKASTLKDYKFTGADVQQLLANLLHNRVSDNLDDASVKDVIQLIKSMYDSGALDGSDGFEKHFITIPNKYNTVCPKCNREGYAVEGLDFRCEHCGHIAKWNETEHRYYPHLGHL